MKRHLNIVIESGETTCYSKPGVRCPQVRVARFGTEWSCQLFGQVLPENERGWLTRLPQCINAEKAA